VIIDSHCHVGEYGRHFPKAFAAEMMGSIDRPPEAITTDVSSLIAQMDAANIDKAFILAFDAHRTLGARVPNEHVMALCRAHPDRFIGFGSVDAGALGAAAEVRRCAEEFGLRGIKIAPAYVHLSPADRRWYPVYETAEALGLPVLAHTGFTPARGATQQHFSPVLVEQVAIDFPHLRLILAHMGTPWVMQCLDMLTKYPNLHADLSIFGWYQPIKLVAQILATARARGVLDRLLWGTDHPWGPLAAFRKRMDSLRHDAALFPDRQALSQIEWTNIMGATALRVLGDLSRNGSGL
jgi:uncharacterized protein